MSNATAPPVTIAEFLLACVAEDEAAAKACAEVYPSPWELSDRGWMAKVTADAPVFRVVCTLEQHPEIEGWLGDRLDHIARHDPARIHAECAAKRRVVDYMQRQILDAVETHASDPVEASLSATCANSALRALASVYSDHPDYRQEWAL